MSISLAPCDQAALAFGRIRSFDALKVAKSAATVAQTRSAVAGMTTTIGPGDPEEPDPRLVCMDIDITVCCAQDVQYVYSLFSDGLRVHDERKDSRSHRREDSEPLQGYLRK